MKCPNCSGDGYFHIGRDGTFESDYDRCIICEGDGYITKERQKFLKRLDKEWRKKNNERSLPNP